MYENILSLKEDLGEFDKWRSTINMKMVKKLEAEMIDAVYRFEDVIESHVLNQFHSTQSEEAGSDHPPLTVYSVDVEEIKQDVDSFIETVNIMKRAYIHELRNPSPEEDDDFVPTITDFGGNESNMVGLSDLFMRFRDWLISPHSELIVMSLDGMAGIGKTTLAKKLFQDPFIASHYSRLVFVTIGPKYRLADILVDILTQLNNADIDEIIWLTKGEELLHELKWKVCESLSELRYLIVLDDVWYTDLCYEFANVFPDDKNGSVALLTTRLTEVSKCVHPLNSHRLPFLDKKESWELLRHKVFDAMPCPRELEKSGKKIAENCEGLPLTIVTVAHILSKTDKTSVYWNQVANDKQNSVYKDAYDQMSNVLYPSYDYLPQHLKACFLYLGAFPQDYMVWRRQLIDLWSAEGFLNRKSTMTSTDYTFAYVGALLSNNLRRLCIRNNVLLAIEDAHDSIASASTVRSLLCTGPYHQYPVPFCLEQLRLLRVLEALSIKSYEFPMEVLKLLQLRYLALTYDGNLPTFISKLFNLQYLIVHHQYRIVKSVGNPYYLPIEIWNMKELKSLEIRGRDLPHPCEGSLLSNLTTLTGVGPQSCTKDVLEKIPNLKELTIQIELVPVASKPFSCFDHIYNLHQLQELECEITNPIFKTEVVTRFGPLSDLPSSLTKLTLSGLGYPWEEMRKISSLPNLTDLVLQCYAFRGPKWEVHDHEFQKLSHFQIEDTDLVHWKFVTTNFCFPAIKLRLDETVEITKTSACVLQ
ncbi:hypothetical protein MIMGU_mgv1a018542mg, partial [Erythranthe guttata]